MLQISKRLYLVKFCKILSFFTPLSTRESSFLSGQTRRYRRFFSRSDNIVSWIFSLDQTTNFEFSSLIKQQTFLDFLPLSNDKLSLIVFLHSNNKLLTYSSLIKQQSSGIFFSHQTINFLGFSSLIKQQTFFNFVP